MIKILDTLADKIKAGAGLTWNEAIETVRRKKKERADVRAAHERKDFPVHNTQEQKVKQAGDRKFLRYALSLIREEHPLHHDFLVLRLKGWSIDRIAGKTGIEKELLRRKEYEARKLVEQKINDLRDHGVPIFSEPPDMLDPAPVKKRIP